MKPFPYFMLSASLVLVGCNSSGSKPIKVNPSTGTELNNRMLGYGRWESFSPLDPPAGGKPVVEDSQEPVTPEEVIDSLSGTSYQCTTKKVSMKATPTKFAALNPDVDALWVGGLIQGKTHMLGIGSLSELPIRERAPITIAVDLPVSDTSREVIGPTSASVNGAITELVNNAQSEIITNNIQLPGVVGFTSKTLHSIKQSTMDLDFSASYMSNSIESFLSTSRSKNQSSVSATFVQQMYTVSAVRPQNAAGFFSNDFTSADLDLLENTGAIGRDNLPVYVSSITYGRMLFLTMTAEASESEIQAILNVSYDGVETSVNVDFDSRQKEILRTAEIKVYSAGGPLDSAVNLINTGSLQSYFANAANLSSAVPISFQIRNVGDNSNALVSDITEYNITNCNLSGLSPFETMVQRMLNGDKFFVTMSGASCIGTIQRQVTYSVRYLGDNSWEGSGKICNSSESQIFVSQGASPESGTFNLWGATFTFDGTGHSSATFGSQVMEGAIQF